MSQKTNLLVDGLIFAGFVVAMSPGFTGVSIHEWLSLALAGTLFVHILLHFEWIKNVLVRFFTRLWHKSRLQFVLDVLLFVDVISIMVSGLFISHAILPALGLQTQRGGAWRMIHSLSADIGIWLVAIHFALNWKWIVNNVGRYLLNPVKRLFQPRNAPVVVPVRIDEPVRRGERAQ